MLAIHLSKYFSLLLCVSGYIGTLCGPPVLGRRHRLSVCLSPTPLLSCPISTFPKWNMFFHCCCSCHNSTAVHTVQYNSTYSTTILQYSGTYSTTMQQYIQYNNKAVQHYIQYKSTYSTKIQHYIQYNSTYSTTIQHYIQYIGYIQYNNKTVHTVQYNITYST
jgi:hypothetical protein